MSITDHASKNLPMWVDLLDGHRYTLCAYKRKNPDTEQYYWDVIYSSYLAHNQYDFSGDTLEEAFVLASEWVRELDDEVGKGGY